MQVPSALVTFRLRLVSPPGELLDRAGVARGRRDRVEQALHLGLCHPASVGLASGHRKIVRSPSWPSCRTVPGS